MSVQRPSLAVFSKLTAHPARQHLGRFFRGAFRAMFAAFSVAGLLLGTLFFAASLTPSLIPRTFMMQGTVSGASMAAGYGIGVFGACLWSYLELPSPRGRTDRIIKGIATLICATVAFVFLWQASEWQNSIRLRMEMPPVESVRPLRVGVIAVFIFTAIYLVARLFQHTAHLFSGWLERHVPRRVSRVVGIAAALALFWSIIDGVLFQVVLRAADASFQQWDALVERGVQAPSDPRETGSAASLVAWEDMGRAGRGFVSFGPTRRQLSAFHGSDALEPIRVFVGLNSEETVEARAQLAVEELKRVGAFERSVLVVITPTGTGWIDPAAINTVEYLHGGDIASVAVQYSYLSSWLSLLVEPGYGAETAQALFAAVYEHWKELPEEQRPELYLHGLSLGALNSELSADFYDIIGDPFQGALWSGPPFSSETWRFATTQRHPGSPAWLPRFRDGSVIRFANQWRTSNLPGAVWGPVRIVYLQYASDPVTFFDPWALYREPAWMAGRPAPDVSPHLQWYPVVSLLQLAIDLTAAKVPPMGYGHDYAPEDYIDAWLAVTDPAGWTPARLERLKAACSRPRCAAKGVRAATNRSADSGEITTSSRNFHPHSVH